MLYQVILLVFCYIVAIGFGIRIWMYRKTRNAKYKHNYICWQKEKHGKHERG